MSETGCFAARGNGSAATASNGRAKIANCSPCMSREQFLESEISRLRNELRQKEKDTEEMSKRSAVGAATTSHDRQDSEGSEVVDAKHVKVTVDGSPGNPSTSQSKPPKDDYREDISAVMREELAGAKSTPRPGAKAGKSPSERLMNMRDRVQSGLFDGSILQNSILGFQKPMRVAMYIVAFAGIVFVLISQAKHLGADDSHGAATSVCGAATDDHAGDEAHHRRLYDVQGRRLGGDAPELIIYIAFVLTASGIIALIMMRIGMPLILGYILGGVLVGPEALEIVPLEGQKNMEQAASLGLIFLLFMIGLELDVKELLKMGKVVLMTGFLQYPVCFGIMWGICAGFGNGLWGGTAEYPLAAMYCGMVCGISSTMIVVKALSEKFETDTQSGRLTIGILIFQDIWAIVVLAVQPKLDNPDIVAILIIFGKMAILLAISLTYAKFIMPAVLFYASKSVELMLVLSLAWCFFIGCIAIQPYMALSFELASLIAGVALATFPYSAEFNGKIKFIRDFFITLFFAQLGMQIPVPQPLPILTAFLMAIIVVAIRPVGIFLISRLMGADAQLASLATLNLSQISEFALVICSLGKKYCHITNDTLTIIIWTFALLAIQATFIIQSNAKIHRFLAAQFRRLTGKQAPVDDNGKQDEVSFQMTVVNLDCDFLDDHANAKRAFEEAVIEVVMGVIQTGQDQEMAPGKVNIDCSLAGQNSTQVNVDVNCATSQSKEVAARLNEGITGTMLSKLGEVSGISEASVGDLSIEDVSEAVVTAGHDQDHHGHDDIVLLGFHRIAFMLVAEFQAKSPEMLQHLHVIDTNQSIMPTLRKKGIKCSYGDICAPDVLQHCHHGEPRLVISTIPDPLLMATGATNAKLLKIAQEVWPSAHYIVTADNPQQAIQLYGAGASYVLRSAKLCAERLQDLLTKHRSCGNSSESELAHLFNTYRAKDKDKRTSFIQQRLH